MRIWLVLFSLLIATATWAEDSSLRTIPDPQLTPGETDPDLTPIEICTTSTSERRSVNVSLKKRVFAAYHVLWDDRSKYEVDHFIPLALGGVNTCENKPTCNLWPQPHQKSFPEIAPWGSEAKDKLELRLYRMMCNNEIDLGEAQDAIKTDWKAAYRKYLGEPKQ